MHDIINDINSSTSGLIDAFTQFPQDKFHYKPDGNIWSAAEVGDHILTLKKLINQVLVGKIKPATERNPE